MGNPGMLPDGVRTIKQLEWIDPALPSKLIMRTQTLSNVHLNHRRQYCFLLFF